MHVLKLSANRLFEDWGVFCFDPDVIISMENFVKLITDLYFQSFPIINKTISYKSIIKP